MITLSFYNIDEFCSKIDLSVGRPVIDLSDVSFVEPYAIIYLGLFMRYYNSLGKYFDWRDSSDTKVRKYLSRMNFYERFNFSKDVIKETKLIRFTSNTSFNDIIDIEKDVCMPDSIANELRELLIRQYEINNVKFDIPVVCEITAEIIDNFIQHSDENLAVMTVQYFPKKHTLSIAIGDCGIGIKKSLSSVSRYSHVRNLSDEDAIEKAFDYLVSRKMEGGTGLSDIRDTILEKNGSLYFSSNEGFYIIKDRKIQKGSMFFELPGVQIEYIFKEEVNGL